MDAHRDDEEEYVPIPLDGDTIARLARLERACGKPATRLAGEIIRDVLIDDEAAHRLDVSSKSLM